MFDLQRLPTELKTMILQLALQRTAAKLIQDAFRNFVEKKKSFSRFLEFIYDRNRIHHSTNSMFLEMAMSNLEMDGVGLAHGHRKLYAKKKHLTVADSHKLHRRPIASFALA